MYRTYEICQMQLDNFINAWNKNDNTIILNGGGNILITFFITEEIYFKIHLDTYISEIYEIIYYNGNWSKAYKILTSNVDDNNKNSLILDGNLTVAGTINGTASAAGFMPITGGAITGDYLCRNVNDRTFDIYGGTAGEGAYMSLFGAQNEGAFYLTAKRNSSQYSSLIGSALGELTWNSNDLAGAAIVSKNLTSNGYIKFASGLILQWGRYIAIQTTAYRYNFQLPLSVNNVRSISFAVDTGQVGETIPQVTYQGYDVTQNVIVGVKTAGDAMAFYWLAICD